ncbi:MAG: hypothetical protein H0U74_14140 [Bradymonadaceae bacterium]|nr:hypothetical protein [Lujinxingiaceae bacterium]
MVRACVVATILLCALAPTPLRAHGAPPAPIKIVGLERDGAPGHDWVFVTNFGVITSDQPARYICEEAFFAGDNFHVEALGLTRWTVFTRSAVLTTEDGCNFTKIYEQSALAAGAASHPQSRQVVFFSNPGTGAEIWHIDATDTVAKLPLALDALRLTSVRFLDAQTLIAGAYADAGAARLLFIDLAQNSVRTAELKAEYTFPYLLASGGQRFVWLGRRDGVLRLFWGSTTDPEEIVIDTERWPTDVALSDDGRRAYFAGVNEERRGVLVATLEPQLQLSPTLDDHSASCLTIIDDSLYVCGHHAREGYSLARYDESGTTHTLVDFRTLVGPRAGCDPASQSARTCPAVWPELARYLEIDIGQPDHADDVGLEPEPRLDVGTNISTPPDGVSPGPEPSAWCSLTAANRTPPTKNFAFYALFALLALVVRTLVRQFGEA